ncbi:hypothetical protein A1O7_04050 [Cladophialophora yegresii CBS 114405]|uniref:Uncharacterized protein n=1 Tax=Cladophialophora yegresii CBS 114405 TaxID=1182544 RepID=W9VW69_9EURO|nr:uncharacterized protein A1O7_04050 [Cladophialophora yegresii CBS 114405]EXJ59903.1 hypothetical protein A1O7_04050 [Cladophialophora yegresii CBS 114405]
MPQSGSLIRASDVVWHPEFTRRCRDLNLRELEKSHLEWLAQSVADTVEDVERARAAQLDVNIAPLFIRDDDDEISAEADKVEAFCPKTTLRHLLTETVEGGTSPSPKALLDERSINGGVISERRNKGPLTARQLYQALSEPRYRSNQAQYLDVRHRHIYLTDLDPECVCAIFGTAPHYQKRAVGSLVYRHLQSAPHTTVSISPQGHNFAFAFHLRYKLMRRSDTPNLDTRRFANNTALREYRNVSFLDKRGNQPGIHCYEAQISYLVTGNDDSLWDSLCISDNYFNSKQAGTSLTDVYEEISQDADGLVALDPSTRGEAGPDFPATDPREKFPRTLAYHLKRVTAEYMRIVDWLNDPVRDYAQCKHNRQHLSKRPHTKMKDEGFDTLKWSAEVKDLADMFSMEVADIKDEVGSFLEKNHILFPSELCGPAISDIIDNMEELEKVQRRLRSVSSRCKSLIETEQNLLQQFPAEIGRKTEFISKSIYPVMIATGIFSMQDHVLPFKANTTAFPPKLV